MVPGNAHAGPKCCLINRNAGSSGDLFPWMFREAGLGKLIGTRTWGGVVGLSGNPGLIDGHSIRIPNVGTYELDGTWAMEGHGVDPDIEVLDDPSLMVDGADPQLDAAIKHLLELLEQNPFIPPRRPPFPDRSGMGVLEKDK
jgi:tricorn protease